MPKKINFKLYPREIQQIKIQRNLQFGKIEVILHSGEPRKIVKREKDIVLNGNISKDLTHFGELD